MASILYPFSNGPKRRRFAAWITLLSVIVLLTNMFPDVVGNMFINITNWGLVIGLSFVSLWLFDTNRGI